VYQSVRAEVAMELGRYDEAGAAFTKLRPYRTQLSIAPRMARWLELTGRALEARALLDSAEAQLASRRDTPRETQAWFALRLGDLEWRRGHPRAAATHYREGLEARPNDPRLLTAMARLAARMHRGADAQWWAQQAVAAQADVNTLLVLAQAQEASGDSAGARHTANAVATLAAAQAGPPHREWLLWQIDHGEQLPQIIARASQDVKERPDVYGYDLLGWALYRDHRPGEARTMLQKAQVLGTRDPLIAAHAEEIGHE
jgi:tetratricopeptide (TPR) repeat protein